MQGSRPHPTEDQVTAARQTVLDRLADVLIAEAQLRDAFDALVELEEVQR